MKFDVGTQPRKIKYALYLHFNFVTFLRNLKTREAIYIKVDLFSIKF